MLVDSALGEKVTLGIDPGSHRCGWGVVIGVPGRYRALDFGCIEPPPDAEPGERLFFIYSRVQEIIAAYNPADLAIEKLFFNRNVTSCIGVAEARGVVLLAAQQAGIPIRQYTPGDIKKALTGSGKADKQEVTLMVVAHLGLDKKPRLDDTADALAAAITHICSGGLRELGCLAKLSGRRRKLPF